MLRISTLFFSFAFFSCTHFASPVSQLKIVTPSLGFTKAGQEVFLGGFSGLHFLGQDEEGHWHFVTHTDRGPTGSMYNGNRPFLMPDFQPRLVFLKIQKNFQKVEIEKTVILSSPQGPFSGRPPKDFIEDPVDTFDYLLDSPYDPEGIDPEAITMDDEGNFWLADDYRPSLLKFSDQGLLLQRYSPPKELPALFLKMRLNRGFKSLVFFQNRLYAFLQSPLSGPEYGKIPVLIFDPRGGTSEIKDYPLEPGSPDSVMDMTVKNDALLVIQQNFAAGPDAYRKIFSLKPQSKDFNKKLFLDLAPLKLIPQRLEGLSFFGGRYLALISDNDYNFQGVPDYLGKGHVASKQEDSYLIIIDLEKLPSDQVPLRAP